MIVRTQRVRTMPWGKGILRHGVSLLVWVLCMASGWCQADTHGQTPETALEVPRELSFARSLFQKGYYYQAIVEFERFLYCHPEHPLVGEAAWGIGRCYQEGRQYRKAIEQYRAVEVRFAGTPLAAEAAFRSGETAYQAGEYEQSIISFRHFLDGFPGDMRTMEAIYRTGWAHIHLHEFTQAREIFLGLTEQASGGETDQYRDASRHISAALGSIKDLSERSPVLAGVLSALLPGAGHVYAGAYKDGLLSFLVNGALIAGAYEAFDKEVYVAGGLVSLVGLGFYSGNIYGGVNSAYHANRARLNAVLRPLQNEYEFISFSSRGISCTSMLRRTEYGNVERVQRVCPAWQRG